MITAQSITEPTDLDAAFAIRRKVFVEGQGVPAEDEYDEHDRAGAHHYLACTVEGTPCGAARWRKTPNGVKLERFAVLEEYRNQAAGAALLQSVLQDIEVAYPDVQVYLHAQLPAVRFYERHGFVKEGEQFSECDIEHFKMVWHRPWLTNS